MNKRTKEKFPRYLCSLLIAVTLLNLSVPAFAAAPALPNGLYISNNQAVSIYSPKNYKLK